MELVPRVTPIPSDLIFDLTLASALFLTFARLYAASWRSAYQHTEPLKFEHLLLMLGLKRAQLHAHLRMLRMAKLLTWTMQVDGHYVIHFPNLPTPESEKSDSGVVLNSLSLIDSLQHTHIESAIPASPPDDPVAAEAAGYLMQVGVWSDRAWLIARQIAENERRGQPHLPTRADVLGWIAYCFAGQQRNRIKQPAAVLSANLGANRRCPDAYRPRRECTACGQQEGSCRCQDEPDYRFPPGFLEQAQIEKPAINPYTSWGTCPECHASPCHCDDS